MKAVADTLQVARSNLAERAARGRRTRPPYCKAGDPELLAAIRVLVDERPTYGYRRLTVLLNRQREALGLPRINHKRVYRLSRRHGLLLERHSGRRPGRVHDGKIVVMRSNLRWCSDAFEIACWNGATVRVGFVLDAHDREAIAWVAVAGRGLSGSDVRDLMLDAVEKRFGAERAPHPIEWLSDNGSPYTAAETRDFAGQLNLAPCFTPVRSPESNGLAEAFIRTFKRDYVRINPLPDGDGVLRQLDGWFEDYNDNHPHSRLGMRSPREFIRAHPPTAACPV
jgi:transposase InsO family protein